MWLTDIQKIGVGLTAAGCFFLLLGVITLFDTALLAFGNILFLAGLVLVIGHQRTLYFFARRQKIRGTICFLLGIVLILCRRPITGFIIEFCGMMALFGDFFSVIVSFLRSLPFIGPVLSSPYIAPTIDRLAGIRVLPI
ncbi:Got1/Sft2-like family-domain-containing protein [Lipomyces chichibuensis]|uniref:Got1/Sft2-like family-domain-containing protein n=1 Tax=Lipomyces chichibuensis TaxID=1546026 RepID=UPI0033438CE2